MAAAQMASKPSKQDSLAPPNTGASYTVPPIEARRTLFMGGLDFAENEENVRVATEAVLVKERGEAKGEKGWVERVRLIRDASTGLGKGFGYVLLRVRSSPFPPRNELTLSPSTGRRMRRRDPRPTPRLPPQSLQAQSPPRTLQDGRRRRSSQSFRRRQGSQSCRRSQEPYYRFRPSRSCDPPPARAQA